MKIATLQTLLTLTNAPEVVSELTAELEKAQKAAERRAVANAEKVATYETAHGVVIAALRDAGAPLTASELWEAVEDEMPEGFTLGRLVYGLSRLWEDVDKQEGRVTLYSAKE